MGARTRMSGITRLADQPAVGQMFAALVDAGDGDLDHASLIRQLRRHNQLPE